MVNNENLRELYCRSASRRTCHNERQVTAAILVHDTIKEPMMNANTRFTDTLPAGAIFQEHPLAPQMVIIPAGSYSMGAPASERFNPPDPWVEGKETEQQITIAEPIAVGRFAVTRREFQDFVEATNYQTSNEAYTYEDDLGQTRTGRDWRNPGFTQDENHPVTCVSWHDAMAYIAWLNAVTGAHYRLLSEAEWEYACRSGSQATYWCGSEIYPGDANYKTSSYDIEAGAIWRKATVPVDSFRTNRWGLSQMHGNVAEWCGGGWQFDPSSDPEQVDEDIVAFDRDRRPTRGGSWNDGMHYIRSAVREPNFADRRSSAVGFRVGRELGDPPIFWRKVKDEDLAKQPFWRKRIEPQFKFWNSIWDTITIPKLPFISFSSRQLICSIYTSGRLPDRGDDENRFNRALRDLLDETLHLAKEFGVDDQSDYWVVTSTDVNPEYTSLKYYRIPKCRSDMSVKWVYVILDYLSYARRTLDWKNSRWTNPDAIQWKVSIGDNEAPWDESAQRFGFPPPSGWIQRLRQWLEKLLSR